MGHPLVQQALSTETLLYQTLKTDEQIGKLYVNMFSAACGPFALMQNLIEAKMLAQEFAEALDCFPSRDEMDNAIQRLFDLLQIAIASYPCIVDQRLFFDKTQWDIEEALLRHCSLMPNSLSSDTLDALIFGQESVTPHSVEGPLGNSLREVPPPLVQIGASFLQQLPPTRLFSPTDPCWVAYKNWRKLYFTAAERGEAILVGD